MMNLPKIGAALAAFALLLSCNSAAPEYPDKPDKPDTPSEQKALTIGGVSIKDFTIVYHAEESENMARTAANLVKDAVKKTYGTSLNLVSDSGVSVTHKIIVGNVKCSDTEFFGLKERQPFDYSIKCSGGNLVLIGADSWGLMGAASEFCSKFVEPGGTLGEKIITGNARGKAIFPLAANCNLRILDDNIWQYDTDAIPDAWKALNADPRNRTRAPEFAEIIYGTAPDVFALQEYSKTMDGFFAPLVTSKGYKKALDTTPTWNYTPLFFNTATVKLVKAEYLKFDAAWSNSGSKSYTVATFELKSNSARFIVLGTHLWWKSESAQAGSNQARENQAKQIIDKINDLVSNNPNLPVFVMGDMNSNLSSAAMKLFTNAGYKAASQSATTFKDGSKGYHDCDSSGFADITETNLQDTNGTTAIDQLFFYNCEKSGTSVSEYRIIKAPFTIRLTDHCPRYMDIKLK